MQLKGKDSEAPLTKEELTLTRLPLKIIFERTQPVEGDFNGVLTLEGNGQLIQVDLSAQIEIPPVIEFFYSDPKVVYISNTNCGSSELPLGASIYDDADLNRRLRLNGPEII